MEEFVHIFENRLKRSHNIYLLFIPAIAFSIFLILFLMIYQNFKLPLSLKGEAVLGEQTQTSKNTQP